MISGTDQKTEVTSFPLEQPKLGFQVTEFILDHLQYCLKNNTPTQVKIPFKATVIDTLDNQKIAYEGNETKGFSLSLLNFDEIRCVMQLLEKPENLQSISIEDYQSLIKPKEVFHLGTYQTIDNRPPSEEEIQAAQEYLDSCPQSPDQEMTGLHDIPGLLPLIQFDQDLLKKADDYLTKKTEGESFSSFAYRPANLLSIDLGFRFYADKIRKHYPEHTFFLVNTGHSIPAASSFAPYMPISFDMDPDTLDLPTIHRLRTQLLTFQHELHQQPLVSSSSRALFIEGHRGNSKKIDEDLGREVKTDQTPLISRLPTFEELQKQGIKRIVVLLEFSPHANITLNVLEYESNDTYKLLGSYISDLQEKGLEVIIRGIDSRRARD